MFSFYFVPFTVSLPFYIFLPWWKHNRLWCINVMRCKKFFFLSFLEYSFFKLVLNYFWFCHTKYFTCGPLTFLSYFFSLILTGDAITDSPDWYVILFFASTRILSLKRVYFISHVYRVTDGSWLRYFPFVYFSNPWLEKRFSGRPFVPVNFVEASLWCLLFHEHSSGEWGRLLLHLRNQEQKILSNLLNLMQWYKTFN